MRPRAVAAESIRGNLFIIQKQLTEKNMEDSHVFFADLADLNKRVGSITSRCSENEPALLPRRDGWTRGFAIVDFHQSEGRLPRLSRQHKLSFLEQFSIRRMRRCYLMWRAIVF